MNLNFWPKMYYSGGGGGGGGSGGGGGGAGGGGYGGGGAAGGGAGYGGGAGAGGAGGSGGGAAGEQPPEEPTPVGAFRFNTDTGKLEYYDGNQWVNITTDSPDLHTGGTRALSVGGLGPGGVTSNIQVIDMSTTGNSVQSDGSYYAGVRLMGGTSSRTRAIFFGGYTTRNDIRFIEIASDGYGSFDFGDLTGARWGVSAASDGTRALAMGGTLGPGTVTAGENFIEYVTISSTGDSVDFGDLTNETAAGSATCSPTRALQFGGYDDAANADTNTIQFVTIATLGNAADFGDLSENGYLMGGVCNAVRSIRMGGYESTNAGARRDHIEFVTTATLGNMTDFGNLTAIKSDGGTASSSTRGIFMGGTPGPSTLQTIDYIQIMTTGDAMDFGDMSAYPIEDNVGVSNGHGGLG